MNLKQILDRFYREYNFRDRILHDPIELPHQYKKTEDIEVSGFIASCFAYGRVDLFKPLIKNILSVMGNSPYSFLLDFKLKRHGHLFSGIKYRFNDNNDIVRLLHTMSMAMKLYGSIEALFKLHFKDNDLNIGGGLTGLIDTMISIGGNQESAISNSSGFLQFFPSPKKGSACKRMNLFLRWMIRDRDIDFGIWKGIPKSKLIIPLDTHIARISRCLGFTNRLSQSWNMAVEITEALKQFDPDDPLKYDFALCHSGISKVCSAVRCKDCRFTEFSHL
jgi:uncharacterized protein (TIGR02757 family)